MYLMKENEVKENMKNIFLFLKSGKYFFLF